MEQVPSTMILESMHIECMVHPFNKQKLYKGEDKKTIFVYSVVNVGDLNQIAMKLSIRKQGLQIKLLSTEIFLI